jgi:hypothetical protein
MTIAILAGSAIVLSLLLAERTDRVIKSRKPPPEPEPSPLDWWDEMQNSLVMVHMDDDRTIKGLIVKVSPDGVLLASPEFLGEGPAFELGGESFIPRERIAWAQVPPAAKPVRRVRKR